MAEVLWTEFDDKEVQRFLKSMDTRLVNAKKGQKEYAGLISATVYKDVIRHFENEIGSEGKWEPWSDVYRQSRDAAYGKKVQSRINRYFRADTEEKKAKAKKSIENLNAPKILQDSGKLRNNFKPSKYRPTNAGPLWFNDARTKSGFPYAAAHDNGGEQLPQRDFMWLSDEALEEISQKTLNYILEQKNGKS